MLQKPTFKPWRKLTWKHCRIGSIGLGRWVNLCGIPSGRSPEIHPHLDQIGNSTHLGYDSSPFWHYKRGLEQGWVPADPRTAAGTCASLGIGGNVFKGVFPASATGGVSNNFAVPVFLEILTEELAKKIRIYFS